jgi:hypothetical protein
MLKVMAATAAGAAATATGIESVIAASPAGAASAARAGSAGNPFPKPLGPRAPSGPRIIALPPGARTLNYMGQEFKPIDTTIAYGQGVSFGSIQQAGGGLASYFRASVDLPNGAVVTQVLFDLIVNDANAATLYFNAYDPISGGFGLNSKSVTTQSALVQTIDMGIPPVTIDAVDFAYALYWFPGTLGATHQLNGARLTWMLNPGVTLFPDPRRVVDGFLTPFNSGTTYGPFDATIKSGGVVPSGVPAGATAAFCAVQSYTEGALTVFPDGAADPGFANYTATASGPLNLTYMMVPLSAAGKFKIHSYISGRCFVDVWGFAV